MLGHFSLVTKVSFFRIPTRAMMLMAMITIRLHGTMPATRISTSCVTCPTPTCFFLCSCPRTWWSQLTWGHWAGDRPGTALCLLVGAGADHQEPAPHCLPGSQAQWVWPLPVGCHSAGQLQWMLGQHCSVCNTVGISRGLHSQLCPDHSVFSWITRSAPKPS